jgi:hypothetical protein
MATPPQIRRTLYGMAFEFGLEEISRAYQSTMNAHAELAASAEAIVRKRYGLTAEQSVPEVEYADDGEPSHDFWEEVGQLENEAHSSIEIIRAAFLIGLFHFWEKHSIRWVDKPAYHHDAVMAWLKTQGYAPDADRLKELELAANCAKHGPGKSCNKLFACRPDLFRQGDEDTSPPFKPQM